MYACDQSGPTRLILAYEASLGLHQPEDSSQWVIYRVMFSSLDERKLISKYMK